MLSTADGLAGTVVPLRDGKVEVAELAQAIVAYVREDGLLARHAARARSAHGANDCEAFLQAHEELYRRALGQRP
jgi:hypothetical protein